MAEQSASRHIDNIIKSYGGWKGDTLSRLRAIIKQADPDVTEEIKWKTASRPEGLPVWSHNGILCIAETWKDNVKLIFFNGSEMTDPKGLFNARLKSATDRAIELREGDSIDEGSLKELVYEAVAINESRPRKR